ncbi:glycosyltransferase [Bacillus cereus group sp. BY105LC]|uniref:glycosyltransferase n=1 Tax=Bacillus cereus group sp. BY105LC TaxID=3018088 RepID=UPI0022E66506|nr:glycosyltransferase [Bacillus cereus group sp. BY105LC]MDA1886860.1 glycosyltransferase [Bacillus cereus group sp. BY105LC]
MKNRIVVITPFYPINHRSDLFEDTKAVFYLLKVPSEVDDILIIHSFMHGFKLAWKKITKLIPIKLNYKEYMHLDDYGNNVFFWENLLLFPKSIKIPSYFTNKQAKLIEQFFVNEDFSPEIGVVHFPTYYTNLVGKLEMIPRNIAIIHSFDIKNIKGRANRAFWQQYFNKYDAIGFRSFIIKREFEELIKFNKKTFMCLSGIPEEYIGLELRETNYNLTCDIKLLYAGRLDRNKNVAKSIKALSRIEGNIQYNFTIVGDGEEKRHIEEVAKAYGISDRVNFTGVVSREETFKLMQEADIFIMVSKKETLGLVYLEAMAAGCIVIGTRGQGIDGVVIDGENGFLTDSESEEAIYETIYRVMNLSPSDQNRIKKNAKKTIESLSDIAVSKEYSSNIHSVLQGD